MCIRDSCGVVHIHVGKLHVGIILCDTRDGIAPQPRGGKDICLINACKALIPLACGFEGKACDALHLIIVVIHDVLGICDVVAALLAKVNVAGQLAQDKNVEVIANDLVL